MVFMLRKNCAHPQASLCMSWTEGQTPTCSPAPLQGSQAPADPRMWTYPGLYEGCHLSAADMYVPVLGLKHLRELARCIYLKVKVPQWKGRKRKRGGGQEWGREKDEREAGGPSTYWVTFQMAGMARAAAGQSQELMPVQRECRGSGTWAYLLLPFPGALAGSWTPVTRGTCSGAFLQCQHYS